ncbi:MAG: efflux RND transporter periplasmic adaptor subunit [Clostridiales bacterium]|nr:efflux RND transporter periplasmic adaptor subunit [Clostridiales bacterium]
MRARLKAVGQALWRHKIRTVIVALVVIFVLVQVLLPRDATSGMTGETAELRDITTYNSFVGNVEADSERSVLAKASAETLEVLVEEGDTVEEGDVIATLDTSDVEYSIAQKEASLASTQTTNEYNIKDAQTNYDNAKEALDSGLNSSVVSAKSQMDSAKEAYETAKSNYSSAKSQINNGTYSATASYYTARSEAKAALATAQANLEDGEEEAAACEADLEEAQAALEAAQADETITDLSSYEAAVTAAQTALTTAQTNLTSLEAAVTSAESAYDTACDQFDSAKESALSSLSDSVSSAKTTYDNAKKSYNAAVLAAEQQLETYENSLEKTEATADTTTSELELQNLYDSLEDYTITAPCSGTITELNISEGDMTTNGLSVATISNLNAMTISITVDEYSIINTSVGSEVTIYVDSIDSTYTGTLTWIADTATISNGVSFYEAEVSFTADDLVRSGMSVEVRLTNVDEKDALSISVDALNYNDDNTAYVYILDEDGNVVTQAVTLGVSDGSYVQITDGLEEGDSVFLAGSSDGSISSTMESRAEMVSGVLGTGD